MTKEMRELEGGERIERKKKVEEGKAKRGQKKTEGRRVDEKNVGETMEEKRKRSEIMMRK